MRPVTVAGLDEIRAAIVRLESRSDRPARSPHLADDLGPAARLDQLDAGELKERVETIGQTEVVQAGFTGLERRIGELAGLESRLDAVAERVPDASWIDELALRVDEVAASIPAVDPVGLIARIDALEQDGQAGSTALERLAAELQALGARTAEQLAGLAAPGANAAPVEELRARLDELAVRITEPGTAPVEELRARLDEIASGLWSWIWRPRGVAGLHR
jgi:hypothetical protein